MRILFVSNFYPPYEFGGYEQVCRDVAVRLAARGHPVHVLTSDYKVSVDGALNEPGVDRSLHLQPSYSFKLGLMAESFLLRRREEFRNLYQLRCTIEHFKPDVIFIWNLQRLPRSIALVAESTPNVAVTYWLAGYTPAEPDEFWSYWNRSRHSFVKSTLARLAIAVMRSEGKPNCPQMKHVAVVSNYMRQRYIAEGSLPAHAEVIYNGVETDQFYRPVRARHDTLTLLQAGRVSIDKGVHTSVEAVGRLVRESGYRNIHLNIAGSGPPDYQAHLQQIVMKYQIEDKVSFLGWLPREQMPELMAKCDVLLLPSDYPEAFARVVLEAMASGLVVIGTLKGGTGEIVRHDVTGLTFPANDSVELAKQLDRLATDNDLRMRLATQGQQLVMNQFGLDCMVNNLERFLEKACADQMETR